MTTSLSSSQGPGFWRSVSDGLSRALVGLSRVARVLFGLALLAGAFVMGLLLAAVLLLRVAFARDRRPTPADEGRTPPRTASRRPPMGEVVDIEAREIGPRAQ